VSDEEVGGLIVRRVAVVAVVFALVAGACTGGDDQSDAGSDGSVTLSLWIFEGEETFLPALKKAFEKENPNVTLKITDIPEDSYVTKMDTALAAGSPPDIGWVYERRWLKAGRVLPLDDVIEANQIDLSALNENALAGCSYEGNIYCLGSYTGAVMLFYNKDLFDEAGLDYPSATKPMSIDEYADIAAQLTKPNEDLSKHVFGGTANPPFWWEDTGTHFSEDGRTIEGFVNDSSTVHTYDVLTTMVRDHVAPSESDFQFFGNTEILATGQLAMSITDNVEAIPLLERAGVRWGAAPTPAEEAGQSPFVSAWTDQFGVFEGSDNPEAAKEFIAFLSTEGNRLRSERDDALPLDSTIAEETDWAGKSDGRREALEVVQLAEGEPFIPGFFDVTGPLWDSFALVVEGEMTAQEALDEVAPDLQTRLDRAWQTWEDT
jgi:multiple sugar transport system substrate-binding protein